ncbi:hypothetical protein A2368_02760 [Candidatus Collierbacteria bacterium RIFOXYB1_FULL_49_13]|uniref:Uncharacterized protein n=1 Tax=Candidatus Collierbacteria bacterium RIFOXYB1_FULL_49_13 TaxID=1817728 RepID=A0A1F5FF14_9BACT|nr:MAG: hypothetical protein A2368_02760 [Candidatus Collierbacteria bacterium RIFOXYB1_FULL_49_13]
MSAVFDVFWEVRLSTGKVGFQRHLPHVGPVTYESVLALPEGAIVVMMTGRRKQAWKGVLRQVD